MKTINSNSRAVNVVAMSSLQLAERFNKRHKNVLRDICKVFDILGLDREDYEDRYIGGNGQERLLFQLCESLTETMILKYSKVIQIQQGAKADVALNTIEQLLGIRLKREFHVSPYFIDGYDEVNNIAYEIDEERHKTPINSRADRDREKYINKVLGCKFVRIDV